jgi:hypothetical protein
MDDIEREIKAVQLRREQLALERELASARFKQKILAGPGSVVGTLAAILRGARTVILAWWKPSLLIALIASAGIGGFAWLEHSQQQAANERERIAREQYHKQLSARIEQKCGRLCTQSEGGDIISSGGGACFQRPGFSHVWCRLQVERGVD